MREIKFRGKRIDNGEWVYGMPFSLKYIYLERDKTETPYLLMFNPKVDIGANVNYLRKPKEWTELEGSVWKVDPESIGQYIGLKDNPPGIKEKVEMYEGDMVRLYTYFDEEGSELNESTIHQIVYDLESDYPAFDLKPYGDWESNGISWALCDMECDGIEVIGHTIDKLEKEGILEKKDGG